jgi:alanine dehydrogenase
MKDCIRVLEEGELEQARGELVARPRIDVITSTRTPHHFYRWGTMEGTSRALQSHAIRMKSDVVYWVKNGDRIVEEKYASQLGLFCGLVFLFDTGTGEPLAIMQEGYLQHMRVGARNALGVKYLAREESHAVGMLGSGGQARSHLMAFCAVRAIKQVKVYSPSSDHKEAYAKEMEELLGIEIRTVSSAREAVAGADIVSCCTNSVLPVLSGDMVQPGMHITIVARELFEDVPPKIDVTLDFARNRIFRGNPLPQSQGAGGAALVYAAVNEEELQEIESSAGIRYAPKSEKKPQKLKARRVSLATLISKAPGVQGRIHEREISSSGSAIRGAEDEGSQGLSFVTVGRLVYDLARENGLGKELPTELFLQDIRD